MMIMIGAGLCALLTAALAMPTNPDVQAPIEALGGSYMVGARYLALALAGTVIAVHAIANCAKKASPTASILEEVEPETFLHNGVSTHGLQRSPMKLNSDGTGIRMASMRRHNPLAGNASFNRDSDECDESENADKLRSASVKSSGSAYSGFGGASVHSNTSNKSRPPSTYEDEMIKEAMRLGFGRSRAG